MNVLEAVTGMKYCLIRFVTIFFSLISYFQVNILLSNGHPSCPCLDYVTSMLGKINWKAKTYSHTI